MVSVDKAFEMRYKFAGEANDIVEYFESQGKRRPLAEIAQN
jgi:hypothetical protein